MDLLKNLDNMITAKLILTGKETYEPEYPTVSKYDAIEAMIEFAKLHTEQALKEASENVIINGHPFEYELDKNSILNAYSLENIK